LVCPGCGSMIRLVQKRGATYRQPLRHPGSGRLAASSIRLIRPNPSRAGTPRASGS
jgi:hypothetical protein